mmetsp:Transcript_68091/g.108031  ORF Transcript_68091/g.108031 Transcript_68091/m.108031 type:complete len:433 (+) Transcript_68091:119-1417(+)|eukprot:CAMPEP_0169091126 /NCGR_PEP_ID=MMETSP1015-20121227/16195_1 /TAXON_ID=342587 /ORGANISM="Karlodinium micrum, Strain CCMP2283" /LENGTH=432 /DNA_ID=CAMNT_0009151595 /DNA_START=111 /DNA_END=1409 /DNA_ORIENTATION=-
MAVVHNSEAIGGSSVSGGVAMKRPNGGKKWSEVCEQVQKPDGSVRIHLTSPPFKNSLAPTHSPQHLRPACLHYGAKKRGAGSSGRSSSTTSRRGSSRGGSSRGRSSGVSSRSSSREKGREGDVSSQCSSGGCGWDSSTNASENVSRQGDTPREDLADSLGVPSTPSSNSKALLMPDPIRPFALLASEHDGHADAHAPDEISAEAKVSDDCVDAIQGQSACSEVRPAGDGSPIADVLTSTTDTQGEFPDEGSQSCESSQVIDVSLIVPDTQLGLILKLDPFGRDAPRGIDATDKIKPTWSVEPLAKYLKSVAHLVESNINNRRLPTEKKLDAFVAKLVATLHRQLRHAPKKMRQYLIRLCAYRFDRFHDFTRNQRVATPSPEELKIALTTLIEALEPGIVSRPLPARVNALKQGSRQWAAPWLHTSLVDVCVA